MEWSYSRRTTFEQCLRSYYWQYYGARRNGGGQSEENQLSFFGSPSQHSTSSPPVERLQFLRRLSNRHQRAGGIAHLVIGAYLKALQRGERWPVDRVLSWARDEFRRDVAYSRAFHDEHEPPSGQY